jgi:uncharacterized protein
VSWLEELFGVHKAVIGMLHLAALPGDPEYDPQTGMAAVVDRAARDLAALVAGGVDGILVSNEYSRPYLTKTERVTAAAMGRVIGELRRDITVPLGVNVLWDAEASLDLAAAVDAAFVREIFTGVYASDFGLWDTNVGRTSRHRARLGIPGVRLLFNVVPEGAAYLASRDLARLTRSTVFNALPDALCVSGLIAGAPTDEAQLQIVKDEAGDVPVFANTGVTAENATAALAIADGAVIGTAFKRDGRFENEVDEQRVRDLMLVVRSLREAGDAR